MPTIQVQRVVAVRREPELLSRRAEGDQQDGRAGSVDLVDDGVLFLGAEVPMPRAGDAETRVRLSHRARGVLGDAGTRAEEEDRALRAGEPFAEPRKEVGPVDVRRETRPEHATAEMDPDSVRENARCFAKHATVVGVSPGDVEAIRIDEGEEVGRFAFPPGALDPGAGIVRFGSSQLLRNAKSW